MIQRDELYQIKGTAQVDEIHIGGKQSLESKRQYGLNKTPFLIAVQVGENATLRFVTFQELPTPD